MFRSARRSALGLAALVFLAGCSEAGDILAPAIPSPESTATESVANLSTSSSDGLISALSSPPYTETWDGRGKDSERCDLVGGEGRTPAGWIHWVFSTKGASTDALLRLNANGSLSSHEPGPPLNAEVWHFYTPFHDLETLGAEIELYGGDPGPGGGLVISDYCPGGRTLAVRKTADTEFTRKYLWDIDKKVETEEGALVNGTPKIWLYTDGSGDETATWTVEVTYEGYEDSDFVIYGDIVITNISTDAAPKSVTSIVDDIGIAGYGNVLVSCTDGGGAEFTNADLPRNIAQGETWNCTYRAEIADGDAEQGAEGTNVVTVRVDGEAEPYEATDGWVFGSPTTEINKTVNVDDLSDLFGEVALGSVTAPSNRTFTYDRDFAWADYGADKCGSYTYDNTATIRETGQTASATLKVNVQCFIDETAYAKGAAPALSVDSFCDAGFSQWGWTNRIAPGSYTWDMWAGAGQCDTARGERVGEVSVTYGGDGSFSAVITLEPGYTLLEEHVYAGSTRFPRVRQGSRLVNTVAPGQYYIEGTLSGNIWVIVHAVVGTPDPDFGP